MIDDVHLSSNFKTNIFEFLRTWSISRGYYDIQKGFFKNIAEFGTVMAENSEYRKTQYKVDGRHNDQQRFMFYATTIYQDEFEMEKCKIFIQHWLTSKMWSTSKIINKYYILITNTLVSLLEKIKRQEHIHDSSFQRLTSFHLISKFCANLTNYTLISDDPKEITPEGLKEEDAACNMACYEIMRTFGDRIMLPTQKTIFLQRLIDSCKQEFITGGHLSPLYIDSLLLGNYSDKRPNSYLKYTFNNN